jgi:Uma2 family endonuclease
MERESDGTVIIMPLVLGGSGKRENLLGYFIRHWQIQTGKGEVYGSTTGFQLPDGAVRAPDTAWISDEKLREMTAEEEENNFIPIVPDFVVEILSSSDRLARAKEKMKNTWMKNGVRLGWLIDPYREQVFIYREGQVEEVVAGFVGKELSGEDVLPGLLVPLDKLAAK